MNLFVIITALTALVIGFSSFGGAIYTGYLFQKSNQIYQIQRIDLGAIQSDPNYESIKRGHEYVTQTYKLLPEFTNAKINCTSCHLSHGTQPNAGPWVGIVGRFPQFRDRSGKVDTLVDRINDCFERSLNGKRIPEDHPVMQDILSYMQWLSKGYPQKAKIEGVGMPKLVLDRQPNLKNGSAVYQAKCASCHQPNGLGLYTPDGEMRFPPLWGSDSFNIGAGMARLYTAAGFVKHNMPFGQGGTLTDDEAFDVAAYFSSKDRPDFSKKHLDWPKGKKPKDARY
jgi:thiosulfate dehydrogenase